MTIAELLLEFYRTAPIIFTRVEKIHKTKAKLSKIISPLYHNKISKWNILELLQIASCYGFKVRASEVEVIGDMVLVVTRAVSEKGRIQGLQNKANFLHYRLEHIQVLKKEELFTKHF